MAKRKKISRQKKCIYFTIITILLLIALIVRLFYLQLIAGKSLKEKAYNQSYTNKVISAKRGSIFDSTGKALAISAEVDTISVNPHLLFNAKTNEENAILKEKVAKAFSEIFSIDYNEILNKLNTSSSVITIAKKVEQDKVDNLKKWMKENNLYSGINIDSDTKRYYPYNNLAAQLIGFCGDDNQGLEGVEYEWDSVLTGRSGKIASIKDASSSLIPNKNETYIAAENGSNITLTIDLNIQTIAEKYLKQAVLENKCKNGGNVIIMQPSTGDILAMATYPDFDLNSPFELNTSSNKAWETLSNVEKTNKLQSIWRNKSVNDTYEPGSTFKILMASIGLEENLVDTDSIVFSCSGAEQIYETKISCWNTAGHGRESLRDALKDSCNPSFMQLGRKIGVEKLYKYFQAFGLFNKTGIALSGEANSNFHKMENIGPVELAVMSFGQRFNITPLQLITAASSVANKGVLMQPRIVKSIQNTDDGSVTSLDTVRVRQVISETTASKVCNMLQSVVDSGTGQYGQVKGYSIAGKTGTSEPPAGQEKNIGFVSSYLAFSPAQNAEVAVLVTLYNPQGKSHQGGQIVGPVVSQILSEVLPYMNIASEGEEQKDNASSITLPDIRNKTVGEATTILKNAGLSCSTSCKSTEIVSEQVPKAGTSLLQNSIVKLYSDTNNIRISATVPDLKEMSLYAAKNALKEKNLNLQYTGTGSVISQDIIAGTSLEEGSIINVILQNKIQYSQ